MDNKALIEQELIRSAIEHEGVKLLFQKLQLVADSMAKKQLALDPLKQAPEIMRSQEFRFVVNEFFPQIIEGLVNYEEAAPDKQLPQKKQWKFLSWFTRLTPEKGN